MERLIALHMSIVTLECFHFDNLFKRSIYNGKQHPNNA